MSLFTAVNGVVKEVTELPIGHVGAVKQTEGLYCGYQGANKLVFGRYRWGKWNIESAYKYAWNGTFVSTGTKSGTYELYASYNFTDTDGFSGNNYIGVMNAESVHDSGYGIAYMIASKTKVIKMDVESEWDGWSDPEYYFNTFTTTASATEVEQKGEILIEEVSSDDASAFPENGVQDGYWYVKI